MEEQLKTKERELKNLFKKRARDTHKGDYGHVFILAGSQGLTGAAALCSNASLRSGAGLVTLGIPASLNSAMEVKLTEVMTFSLAETKEGSVSLKAKKNILAKIKDSDVVILGPGLSCNPETCKLVRGLLVDIKKKMVLDADALNAIAGNAGILKKIKTDFVITPHPGEMARLISKSIEYVKKNRKNIAEKIANLYNACVVLKGTGTIVSISGTTHHSLKPEKMVHGTIYVNRTGNPGMATAGSGDVLTGIIGGFLAQGLNTFEAAKLAVYIHGLAGDIAAKEKGEAGLIASDILEKIPEAIKKMK